MASERTFSRSDGGFTLLEVMVVVLVIGILLAVGIPTYLGARERAQDRAAQQTLRNTTQTAQILYATDGHFGNAIGSGLSAAEPAYTYTNSTTPSLGPLHVSYRRQDFGSDFGGAVLSDSGTCFYIVISDDAAPVYGSSDTAPCQASSAPTVAVDPSW